MSFKQIFAAALVIASLPLSVSAAPGPIRGGRIISVHVRENIVDVHMDPSSTNSSMGCTNQQLIRLRRSQHPNSDAMISAAMTAFAAGKSVTGWINECDGDGVGIASSIWMY